MSNGEVVTIGEYERLKAERDDARRWARAWKAAAKKHQAKSMEYWLLYVTSNIDRVAWEDRYKALAEA